MNWKTILIVSALFSCAAQADQTATNSAPAELLPRTSPRKLLESNDPNYFVLAIPTTHGELSDDSHLEFYISIQHPLLHNLLFIYNGLYDFYIIEGGRYKSAPIISRRQNPGLTYEYYAKDHGRFRLGYFHESNGQTLENADDIPAFNALVDQHGKEYALAQVSRGWDYIEFRYQSDFSRKTILNSRCDMWQRYHIDLRHFMPQQMFTFDREDDIFWDPDAKQSTIRDYDGLRLMYEIHLANKNRLDLAARLEVKTGTSSLDTLLGHSSYKVSLNTQLWRPVFTLFYFDGYGKEPSTYNERTQYVGFGLEFR